MSKINIKRQQRKRNKIENSIITKKSTNEILLLHKKGKAWLKKKRRGDPFNHKGGVKTKVTPSGHRGVELGAKVGATEPATSRSGHATPDERNRKSSP